VGSTSLRVTNGPATNYTGVLLVAFCLLALRLGGSTLCSHPPRVPAEGLNLARSNPNQVFDDLADVMIARQEEWRWSASCKGKGNKKFFPATDGSFKDSEAAKAVCRGCPVQVDCYEAWQRMPSGQQAHGVWAGRDQRIWRNELTAATSTR
jgi:predicted Fe-S protein YdhL (DUF1289 family)